MNTAWRWLRTYVADACAAWDRFWFQPLGTESLGVLRLFAGGMVFYTHWVWGLNLDAFFGSQGWQDPLLVQTFHRDPGAFSLWTYVPDAWLGPVHYLCLTILACFWAGLFTRVTSVLAFAILVSYANRVPLATFGLDQINGLLTLYLAIAPSGDCFSVDQLIRRFRTARRALAERQTSVRFPRSSYLTARLGTRLIEVHMCVLYFIAGLSKLKGETWWDGTAIWLGAANYEYQSGDLTWLCWYPWLVNAMTHGTIAWELSFCALVWLPRWRPLVLAAGVAMHLGIGGFLGMWTFGLVMIFTYISFVPPELMRTCWEAFLPERGRAVTYGSGTWDQVWAAARCACSWRDEQELRPAGRTAGALPGLPSPTAPLAPQPLSPGDWWRQLASLPAGDWPLPTTAVGSTRELESVLIVSSHVQHQLETQAHFSTRGHDCRVAHDVPQACAALSHRAAQCVVIYIYHRRELDDVQRFRLLCAAAGSQAPTTVVAFRKELIEDVVWEPTVEHRLLTFPFSLRELRQEARTAWQARVGVPSPPPAPVRVRQEVVR
jgi:uncharacterized membrane protein YphA (DoxX/SURF4 family)